MCVCVYDREKEREREREREKERGWIAPTWAEWSISVLKPQ